VGRCQEERYSIERLRKAGYKQNAIAELLDRSEGTISREIGRNTGKRGYRSVQAGELAAQRRQGSLKATRFTAEVQTAVEYYLGEDYSPEQVTGFMRRQGENTVIHERIYQHIYADFKAGGNLHKHLRHKCKRRKRRLGRPDKRGSIVNRVGI
jgi:IS30 family transposase